VTAQAKKLSGAGSADPRWDGFLDKTDRWQVRASHRMSAYFTN
jgi:hypothetical protein